MKLGQQTLEKRLKYAIKSNDLTIIHNIFDEIYVMYGKLVYFKIAQYIDNKHDVAELTQDVFISFYNNIFNVDISNIKYYLITSSKNKAIDYLRHKKEIIINDDIIDKQEDIVTSNIEYEEIIEKMKLFLTEFEIELIIKHNIDGYTFKELSNQYKRPINTLISIYNRSLKKFRKGNEKNERN